MSGKENEEFETTVAKILYILETRKTIPSGLTPTQINEIYARMISQHIHRNFVLKLTKKEKI